MGCEGCVGGGVSILTGMPLMFHLPFAGKAKKGEGECMCRITAGGIHGQTRKRHKRPMELA